MLYIEIPDGMRFDVLNLILHKKMHRQAPQAIQPPGGLKADFYLRKKGQH